LRLEAGDLSWEWIGDFAEIPESEAAARGWAHHDIALSPSGTLLTFHPGLPLVLELDTDGTLLGSWEAPLSEAHGITVASDGAQPCLWFADNGRKRNPDDRYEYRWGPKAGHTIKTDLDGQVLAEFGAPALPAYADDAIYSPTKIAVHEPAIGGTGDVWTADGYGQNLIHRYSSDGSYVLTIDGTEGAGAFKTPHAIHIDTRGAGPELYVADRASGRVQVFDLDGDFKRSFGDEHFITPAAFAPLGEHLVVAQLNARVTILDGADQLVGHLGDNHEVASEPGWPNMPDAAGVPSRTDRLHEGLFNSPHGVATDEAGNIYVSEWLIGGRYTKLARR
jgi:hypothetical protein